MKYRKLTNDINIQYDIYKDKKRLRRSSLLRPCIDPYCAEWEWYSTEEKLKGLRLMKEITGKSYEKLIFDCYSYCVFKAGKEINPQHVFTALSRLLEYSDEGLQG